MQAGQRILEVGCGVPLVNLVGHRRGADVTASDCHPLAAGFSLENVRINGLLPLQYRHGRRGALPTADEKVPREVPNADGGAGICAQ